MECVVLREKSTLFWIIPCRCMKTSEIFSKWKFGSLYAILQSIVNTIFHCYLPCLLMRDIPNLFYLQNDETLQNCRKELLVSDRVQVISEVKNSITKIWDESDCISKFFYFSRVPSHPFNGVFNTNVNEFL